MESKLQIIIDKHLSMFIKQLSIIYPKIYDAKRRSVSAVQRLETSDKNKKKIYSIIDKWKHAENIILDKKTQCYVHHETGLIFDPVSKKVIGKNDGSSLDSNDIEICNQYKFSYDMPKMLCIDDLHHLNTKITQKKDMIKIKINNL